jgi:hypothetical protein
VSKRGHQQQLCSISSDGTVQQWSMKKGLIPHELMSLKRKANKAHIKVHFLFNNSAFLSFRPHHLLV